MKILVIGSDGFVGSAVKDALSLAHEVYGTTRNDGDLDESHRYVDLLDKDTIAMALASTMPQVIISCAGVVENTDRAKQNPIFTSNLLEQVVESGIPVKRIILTGSAAEYGVVRTEDIPVNEDTPTKPNSIYGTSKLEESLSGLAYANEHNLPVVIARIFNPIGLGMHEKFLIPRIIQQIKEVKAGSRTIIEVSRLDSRRDYVDVRDVAEGLKALVDNSPKEHIYNIGSGESTSNGELVALILKGSGLEQKPQVVETSLEPEPLVAIQADITRMYDELGWRPNRKITDTVREILDATKK